MKKITLTITLLINYITTIGAQGFAYTEKTELGNGLYKVKSGNYYGIIDKNDNVVLSVEYQDLLFREGKALLTKDDILLGIIDTLGTIKTIPGEYKVHPRYKYIYEGFIPVSQGIKWGYTDKWGYIDENGKPLQIKQKIKGAQNAGKKYPTLFDNVTPFVDGCASIYLKKSGWRHIDKDGLERFKLNDKKAYATFRSSIHKGECIIVTDDGIKQYQENETSQAIVKRILSTSATWTNAEDSTQPQPPRLTFKEGTLTLDSLMRVVKYQNGTDSITFIEKPKKIIIKKDTIIPPVDTLSAEKYLNIGLASRNLQANAKGRAYAEIKIKNTSNTKFENISVLIECPGATRKWDGNLQANSEVSLTFNIPARFSTTTLKRNIIVHITYKEENIEKKFPITIRRYTPIRSR